MSRGSDHAFRVALVAIREIATARTLTPETALAIIAEALGEGVEPPPIMTDRSRPKTGAQRTADWKRRHRVTAGDAPGDEKGDAGDVTADATGDVSGDVSGDVTRPPGPPRDQDSHSLEIPEERESETRACATPVTSPVTGSVTRVVTSPVTKKVTRVTGELAERYVTVTDPLPSLLREAAAMVPVRDITGAWAKFTGHYAGKFIHVQGAWQKWCVNEAKRERTDFETQRRDRPGDAPDFVDPSSAEASERRKRRETAKLEDEVRAKLARVGGSHG